MFSEAATRELNEQLQVLVAAGDEPARQRMIESNMRLAAYKVDQFISQYPHFQHLHDDLLSEAFVGLTKAVNDIRDTGCADNPTAFISICMWRQLLTAGRSECDTVAPLRSASLTYDPDNTLELRDLLNRCCESDDERSIVRLRESGFNDTEIAEELGLHRRHIGCVRKNLAKKFGKMEG